LFHYLLDQIFPHFLHFIASSIVFPSAFILIMGDVFDALIKTQPDPVIIFTPSIVII